LRFRPGNRRYPQSSIPRSFTHPGRSFAHPGRLRIPVVCASRSVVYASRSVVCASRSFAHPGRLRIPVGRLRIPVVYASRPFAHPGRLRKPAIFFTQAGLVAQIGFVVQACNLVGACFRRVSVCLPPTRADLVRDVKNLGSTERLHARFSTTCARQRRCRWCR
jgi:hypothetical protein